MSSSASSLDRAPAFKSMAFLLRKRVESHASRLEEPVERFQPAPRPAFPADACPASPEAPVPSLSDGGSTPPEGSPHPSSPPPPPFRFLPPFPPPPPPAAPRDETPRTRLWLKGLPADLDYAKLFRHFHKIGKVAAASIHPGRSPAGPSSDVLLTFCRRADCQRFVRRRAAQPFSVDGRVARLASAAGRPATATERAAETADADADDVYGGRTRVLLVSGAADLVNKAALEAFAADRGILVDTVNLAVVKLPGGTAHADWQLGSIETQARRLFDALARLAATDPRLHDVRYGHDTCENH